MLDRQVLECASPLALSLREVLRARWLRSRNAKRQRTGVLQNYLLPGLTGGMAARSSGSLSASKVSTCIESKLNIGKPKLTVPPERSTSVPTPTTWPPWEIGRAHV